MDFSTITACGESCADCKKRSDGICKGCIEADGYVPEWAGSGRCKIHACTRNHNVQFCGICDNFPCQHLTDYIHWNPNIVEHLTTLVSQYHKQNLKGEKNMEITEQFKKEIAPFTWIEHEGSASVCLNAGEYLQEIFDTRANDGFEGSGYDWESLAKVFLEEKCSDLIEKINFDSEAGMFCVYSKNIEALQEFIRGFKNACMDKTLILDLFSRAELD